MQEFEVKLGPWLPDRPRYDNPGLLVAENVYPIEGGYTPFLSGVSSGVSTDEQVRGAEVFIRENREIVEVFGSATKLWTRIDQVLTPTTGYNPLEPKEAWRFARFNDRLIAVTRRNNPQTIDDLNVGTTWEDLGGNPPKASVVGRVNDFLMLGDLEETDAEEASSRVRWSALNNPEAPWVYDRGDLSGYQTLDPRFGRVTGIVGGRDGLVFQERAIHRASFIGAPRVFRFEPITTSIGCIAPDSIIEREGVTYFVSEDGVGVTNGATVEIISNRNVSEWVSSKIDGTRLTETQGDIDVSRNCIVWNFYSGNADAAYLDQLIYNYALGQWSHASVSNDWLLRDVRDNTTIGELDAPYPGGIGTIPHPVGWPGWRGTPLGFGAFVADGSGGSERVGFRGEPVQATFELGEWQAVKGRRTFVSGVSPLVEMPEGDWTASAAAFDKLGGTASSTPYLPPEADEFAPVRIDGRYVSARFQIANGVAWDKASGVQIRAMPSGGR